MQVLHARVQVLLARVQVLRARVHQYSTREHKLHARYEYARESFHARECRLARVPYSVYNMARLYLESRQRVVTLFSKGYTVILPLPRVILPLVLPFPRVSDDQK